MSTPTMTRRAFLGSVGAAAMLPAASQATQPHPRQKSIRDAVSTPARTFSLPGPGPDSVDIGDSRSLGALDALSPGPEVGVDAHTSALQMDLEAKLAHYEGRSVHRVVDARDEADLSPKRAADLGLDESHALDPDEPVYQMQEDPSEKGAIHLSDNTTIELRPGTYVIPHTLRGTVRNWTLRGTGEKEGDVRLVTRGGNRPLLDIRDGRAVSVENLTMHNGANGENAVGLSIRVEDDLLIKGLHHTGLSPNEGSDGDLEEFNHQEWSLNVSVTDPDGVAVTDRFIKTSPTKVAGHAENDSPLASWSRHRGIWYIRNSVIWNGGGDGGTYISRTPGGHRFDNCLFRNNYASAIRVAGGQSWVRNCTIRMNRAKGDVENEVMFPDQMGMNAITWESSSWVSEEARNRAGGLVENCTIEAIQTGGSVGYINVDGSHGGIVIRNTHIRNETRYTSLDGEAPGDSFMNEFEVPDRPHGIYLENCEFTGSGTGTAINIVNRPESIGQGICVRMPNGGEVSGLGFIDGGPHCRQVESPESRRPALFEEIIGMQGKGVSVGSGAGGRGFAGLLGMVVAAVIVPIFVVLGMLAAALLVILKLVLD